MVKECDVKCEPIYAEVNICETKVKFEMDSGSPISAVPLDYYKRSNFNHLSLQKTNRIFKADHSCR